jgi:hypothetical protein
MITPPVSSRTSSTWETPLPRLPSSWTAVELRSPRVRVEWAALLLSAWTSSAGRAPTARPGPPQLTTRRFEPSDSSKASVEAQPPAKARVGGGGAASNRAIVPFASRR